MTSWSRLVTALLLLLVSFGSAASVCAGWQASAHARMACCESEATCPMHVAKQHGQPARAKVSQIDADNCCSASERGSSTPPTPSYVGRTTLAVLESPIPAVGPDVAVFHESPNGRTSFDVSPVPTHLLLSVFLI